MARHSFIQIEKIKNVKGRINYKAVMKDRKIYMLL